MLISDYQLGTSFVQHHPTSFSLKKIEVGYFGGFDFGRGGLDFGKVPIR